VVAAQVPVLVGQDRQHPLPVDRHQQGQSDREVVAGAAEQAPARHLADAGVEIVVEVDAMDPWALDPGADAVQRLEQRGRVVPLHVRTPSGSSKRTHNARSVAQSRPAREQHRTQPRVKLKRSSRIDDNTQTMSPAARPRQPSTHR
jgi:hypothetical protein